MLNTQTSTAADRVQVWPKFTELPGCPVSSATVPEEVSKRCMESPIPSTALVTVITGVSRPSATRNEAASAAMSW